MNGVMNRAVRNGADRPRYCGTSSPTTMEKAVARTRAMATETASTLPSPRPVRESGPRRSEATLGSTRKPTSSVVRVMPTWDAESWVDRVRSAARTGRLRWSPSAMARSTAGRSSVM